MNPVLAFVVVMLVWTVSDMVAKKTKSLLSSLFVASIIFFIGFLTGIFPDDLGAFSLTSTTRWRPHDRPTSSSPASGR